MAERGAPPYLKVRTILHATDFSPQSEAAFAHALKMAVDEHAGLTILHASRGQAHEPHWHDFPSVRGMLARWGLLEEGARQAEVYEKLGVKVHKVAAEGGTIVGAIVNYLERHNFDMLVVATHGREGLPRWLLGSVSEPVARHADVPTLFVPHGARGCVSLEDGSVTLERVLIPVDHEPPPQIVIKETLAAVHALGVERAHLGLFYVGREGDMPRLHLPDDDRWQWHQTTRTGKPADQILAVAEELPAHLIAMVTAGREGFLDALRGSTTEQILHGAPCPVLAVPAA